MLRIARENFWYPGVSTDIINVSKSCEICHKHQGEQKERLHPWQEPDKFFDRVHIDYAGPFQGYMWLIVIDAKTNWLEVVKAKTPTTDATIAGLKSIFARFGLPKAIVSDNGTCFTSEKFKAPGLEFKCPCF
uniref:Integrase catalytic domain-containing protein n=1 Tax=Panagrolaimus superbus TaxID=310955 RepID=A0A914YZD7_9BILA